MLLYRVFLIVMEIPLGGLLLGGWAWAQRPSTRPPPRHAGDGAGGGMRILHLTDHYPPVLGGIEAHVAALAARQAARGDDVTVLTSTPAAADGRVAHDRGPVRVRRARTAWDVTARDLAGVRRGARPHVRRRPVHSAGGRPCRPSGAAGGGDRALAVERPRSGARDRASASPGSGGRRCCGPR